ncbi:C-type natriuretic peptide 2-like [Sebastes fasciatus]|uniref:C-type natriuretic peptide 2-like n=1 Tax=Sebastes fasciatus TaxID=394691 RepID=UPI003D9E2702
MDSFWDSWWSGTPGGLGPLVVCSSSGPSSQSECRIICCHGDGCSLILHLIFPSKETKMAASSCSSFVPLLLLFLTVAVETRPSAQRDDRQVLDSLFGSRLSSLMLAPPTSDDITEGSAGRPAPFSSGLAVSRGAARGLLPGGGRREAVPRFFLDFLQRQSKMRRRSRKSMFGGGRGCFGMKMDRIGSISGLGC